MTALRPTVRAQLLLTPEDAANGRELARRMGVSFSAWVRIQIREAWRAESEREAIHTARRQNAPTD